MKLSITAALAATMLSMPWATATAGEKVEVPVTIETNALGQVTRAYGMAGTARNSADAQQLIACFVSATSAGAQGGCEARNAAGVSTMCLTSNAGLMAAVQSVRTDSYIDFSRSSAGQCTGIYVANGSPNAVKLP